MHRETNSVKFYVESQSDRSAQSFRRDTAEGQKYLEVRIAKKQTLVH